jgi:DNA-binding NarL/FixJ family response regulator
LLIETDREAVPCVRVGTRQTDAELSRCGAGLHDLFHDEDYMRDASKKNTACIRVLIADDQPISRRSLKALLTALRWCTPGNTDHGCSLPVEIVGEAVNGEQAVQQARALQPDVVVMDLHQHIASVPESKSDGWTAIRAIKSEWPAIRIVVLTLYAAGRTSALAAGADVFLLKGCPTKDLLDAVMFPMR